MDAVDCKMLNFLIDQPIGTWIHTMVWIALGLLLAYQVKHFLADYILQGAYMLGKFKDKGWLKPLAAHAGVHFLGTFLITCYFGFIQALGLAAFDFVVHFCMDRLKASPSLMGRWKPLTAPEYIVAIEQVKANHCLGYTDYYKRQLRGNRNFWWALGFDQAIHHLTHYAIIGWLLLS